MKEGFASKAPKLRAFWDTAAYTLMAPREYPGQLNRYVYYRQRPRDCLLFLSVNGPPRLMFRDVCRKIHIKYSIFFSENQ